MHLTQRHLALFRHFAGDIDGLQRSGTSSDKLLFEEGEWRTIELLLHFLRNKHAGYAAGAVDEQLDDLRRTHIQDTAVWDALLAMAQSTEGH